MIGRNVVGGERAAGEGDKSEGASKTSKRPREAIHRGLSKDVRAVAKAERDAPVTQHSSWSGGRSRRPHPPLPCVSPLSVITASLARQGATIMSRFRTNDSWRISSGRRSAASAEIEAIMPLRDHFRPPLDDVPCWDELHGMWPAIIVRNLNAIVAPRCANSCMEPRERCLRAIGWHW